MMNVSQQGKKKDKKRNIEPVQLVRSIRQSSQLRYIPLCAERDAATLHTTAPSGKKKKKKEKPIEKVGRGLFSFRALSDMTASMKRLWLENNVAYRYQPDWQ